MNEEGYNDDICRGCINVLFGIHNNLLCSHVILLLLITVVFSGYSQVTDSANITIENQELGLFDLMNIKVSSASKVDESISHVPATTIILTGEEIQQRGYTEIFEIFDDLPGMHLARTYGDNYFRNYIRGYRTTNTSPLLFLIDGVLVNDIFYNEIECAAAIPLSNIDKVEIVYGPSSSIYGSNASMGIVNVITRRNGDKDGYISIVKLGYGYPNFKNADLFTSVRKNNIEFSVATKLQKANLRDLIGDNRSYWTQDCWYQDTTFWGNYLQYENLLPSHGFDSPLDHTSVDLRLYFGRDNQKLGETQLGYRKMILSTGYGVEYSGDKMQSPSMWNRSTNEYYIRNQIDINEKAHVSTMIRLFEHELPNENWSLELYGNEIYNGTDTLVTIHGTQYELKQGALVRNLAYYYWQFYNNRIDVIQDWEFQLYKSLNMLAGLKYSYRDVQKAYGGHENPALTIPFYLYNRNDMFPQQPIESKKRYNREILKDQGAFVQLKYSLHEKHLLNVGLRADNNSVYGARNSFRATYVGLFNRFSVKLLYGEAYSEPTPRNLYAGWKASGSSPQLKPESSQTLEVQLSHFGKALYQYFSLYFVNMDDVNVQTFGGANNLGHREVVGLDYHFSYSLYPDFIKELKLWAYYSAILWQMEEIPIENQYDQMSLTGDIQTIVGDLSKHTIKAGLIAEIIPNINLTILQRFIGKRETVRSNPVRFIDAYMLTDANIQFENLIAKGVNINLKITNVFNTKYFHPGIKDADSGESPGSGWSSDGNLIWNGSEGWFNSQLPQPGRLIIFSLSMNL